MNILSPSFIWLGKSGPSASGSIAGVKKPINKFNLLKLINKAYGLNKKILADESLKVDRTLNCSKFMKETNFESEEWQVMIDRMKSFK